MASQNNQIVTLHRRVKELTYNETTGGWDIIFIDNAGVERPGVLPHAPRIGMNYCLALQVVIANYCINNNEDDNLWMPQVEISDVFITVDNSKPDNVIHTYHIEYINGIKYKFKRVNQEVPLTEIDVIENLTLQGIAFYIDNSTDEELELSIIAQDSDVDTEGSLYTLFNNEILTTKVELQDNANMDVTPEQVTRVLRHLLKACFMLYGMYKTRIAIMRYSSGRFTNCNDMSIPSFEIDMQDNMQPQAIVFDDLTYIVCDDKGQLILSVNE